MRARILVRGLNAQRTGNIHIFLQAERFVLREENTEEDKVRIRVSMEF